MNQLITPTREDIYKLAGGDPRMAKALEQVFARSASFANFFMASNAVPTTFTAISTPTKVLGTTTALGLNEGYATDISNRATQTGPFPRTALVSVSANLSGTAGDEVSLYVAKGGSVVPSSKTTVTLVGGSYTNAVVQTLVNLPRTTFVEVFIENGTSTDAVTVTEMNAIVQAVA